MFRRGIDRLLEGVRERGLPGGTELVRVLDWIAVEGGIGLSSSSIFTPLFGVLLALGLLRIMALLGGIGGLKSTALLTGHGEDWAENEALCCMLLRRGELQYLS